jgi:hypothetical protein
VDPATWQQVITRNGFQEVSQGLANTDPFAILANRAAQQEASGTPSSRVTVTLKNAHPDYNRMSVAVTISCPCASMESDIALAGEAAYTMAHHMTSLQSGALGLPPLE